MTGVDKYALCQRERHVVTHDCAVDRSVKVGNPGIREAGDELLYIADTERSADRTAGSVTVPERKI